MGYKFGIAISTFDKFDELAVLHDIFRHNFQQKFHLYVCSNHPNAQSEINKRGLIFDGFIQGENIEYTPTLGDVERKIAIVCRSTDTVLKSCSLAMQDTDYVMHIHCDAWPLDETTLVNHFHSVIDSGYNVAVRGLGYSASRDDAPLGHIDDHFFIFNSKIAKEVNLFDFRPIDFLPHKWSVHGILTAHLLTKIGAQNILFFDRFSETSLHECWLNQKKKFPSYPVKPSLIDNERSFIHIHTASFPNDLGRQLQVYYLKSHSLKNGANLQAYLKSYNNAPDLHELLSKALNTMEKRARLRGYVVENFGQDIIALEKAIAKTTLKTLIFNYTYLAVKKFLGRFNISLIKKSDKIWPVKLEDFYRKKVTGRKLRSFINDVN